MGRRAEEPLDKRKNLTLFQGDWERLEELLNPIGIPTGVFLRQLVRKKILQLEAAKNDVARPTGDINVDTLIANLDSQSAAKQPVKSG